MINDKGIKATDKHVFFWGSWLSNWYKSTITLEDNFGKPLVFFTSEQYFMWRKAIEFNDIEIANKILATKDPKEAKKLGREVHNFDSKHWDKVKYQIMLTANLHKYSHSKELEKALCSSEFQNKTFVEASPYDRIWGIGMHMNDIGIDDESNWKGQNLLGKCLTEIRDTYKSLDDEVVAGAITKI